LQPAKCGYALILMAIYWVTESLPLTVTALLPLFLFPVLEILTGKEVATCYIQVGKLLVQLLLWFRYLEEEEEEEEEKKTEKERNKNVGPITIVSMKPIHGRTGGQYSTLSSELVTDSVLISVLAVGAAKAEISKKITVPA